MSKWAAYEDRKQRRVAKTNRVLTPVGEMYHFTADFAKTLCGEVVDNERTAAVAAAPFTEIYYCSKCERTAQ